MKKRNSVKIGWLHDLHFLLSNAYLDSMYVSAIKFEIGKRNDNEGIFV